MFEYMWYILLLEFIRGDKAVRATILFCNMRARPAKYIYQNYFKMYIYQITSKFIDKTSLPNIIRGDNEKLRVWKFPFLYKTCLFE